MTHEAAEIVDTSHVDQVLANARKADENVRRRAMIWTIGKSTVLGGVGLGLLCFGASFLVQPKIVETTKVVEIPEVIETTKLVEGPAKVIDGPKELVTAPLVQPPKPATPTPNPGTETHAWNELTNKRYMGIITDVYVDRVCYDHRSDNCTNWVVVGSDGRAVLDANGRYIMDEKSSLLPMRKWIGYSAYSAARPADPAHLADFWVANNGTLILYETEPKG